VDNYDLNVYIARAKGTDKNDQLVDWRAFSKNMLMEVYGEHLHKFSSCGSSASNGTSVKYPINRQFRDALLGKINNMYLTTLLYLNISFN